MKSVFDTAIRGPEILAPAGTYEALEAAVNAGADAVYLGGDLFSARAFAGNFSKDVLLKAMELCHFHDVKIYMTVNTLFKEQEIEMLVPYLKPFYDAGLDAVIVQDPGAAFMLREAYSDLPLHASTQMSISSASGAALLKTCGFTRVVPARELTLEEIISIKQQVEIEIETFVHGAMCFAYSGKCLFSSFLGGRSGNRGRCAQPCRQWYTTAGAKQTGGQRYTAADAKQTGRQRYTAADAKQTGGQRYTAADAKQTGGQRYTAADAKQTGGHLMSLKDMCVLEALPQLVEAGIESFKIEGRMKNPQYVAGVTSAYRQVRDLYLEQKRTCGCAWDQWEEADRKAFAHRCEDLKKDLMDLYNRGGFCSGYYFTEKGKEMFSYDRPNHTGRKIGTVKKISGPDVSIRLTCDLHKGDVVEIRTGQEEIELTSPADAKAGAQIVLKGKGLKRIRPGMEVFRTRNNYLLEQIDKEIIGQERTVAANACVEAQVGKPLSITLSDADGVRVRVSGGIVEKASKQPVTKEQLSEKLMKTKGSRLLLEPELQVEDGIFVSMSEFNALRREAMERFRSARAERSSRK